MFQQFKQRSNQAELIDELTLSGDALRRNLEELAFINHWLGGNTVTLKGLDSVLQRYPQLTQSSRLRIADLGCGGGDMLVVMARWAQRKGLRASFVGIDANDFILQYARHHTASHSNITYLQQNIFSEEFNAHHFDLITCTLFCHHFNDQSLIDLFSRLRRQADTAIIINDLHRHWLAYYSIGWLTHWFSKSYLVKHDAKLSVWRAFRRSELEHIIRAAGFSRFEIRWRWAFRWQIILFPE